MKTLAAAQNQQKNIESQQQKTASQSSSNKSDKLEINNSSRVNVVNTWDIKSAQFSLYTKKS